MTNQHPITPPPELVREWTQNRGHSCADELWDYLAAQAAQWGADTELDACCEWFQEFYKTESWVKHDLKHFRAARRPKPPSLKEQALGALACIAIGADSTKEFFQDIETIRRALEALPND